MHGISRCLPDHFECHIVRSDQPLVDFHKNTTLELVRLKENGVKLRNKFPPPNRCTFVKINVRDTRKYTVRHSSIQVRLGLTEPNAPFLYHPSWIFSELIAISFALQSFVFTSKRIRWIEVLFG